MVAKRVRDQRRARAHAGRRSRRLAAGMAAADNDDVEGFVAHGTSGSRIRPQLSRSAGRQPNLFHVKHSSAVSEPESWRDRFVAVGNIP